LEIVVCVKRVTMTQEVDFQIDPEKRGVRREGLAFVINDWDNYAVEEAVAIKERLGGSVTAVTVGSEEDEEVLRRALAMGADRAIRVDCPQRDLDPWVLSNILASVIRAVPRDLILTGVQADDDNWGAVGGMLAARLGIRHAAVVNRIEIDGDTVGIHVELEGGMDELSRVSLPALFAVQTGINEPRYVSIMGIRKASKKELRVVRPDALGLGLSDLESRVMVQELYPPPETAGAQIIEGDPQKVAEKIIQILKEKGAKA
jgi:electron transfer flavoprotein beta subunit